MYLTTNISAQSELIANFYKEWVNVYCEIVANIVDDYSLTQDTTELEQLVKLHCSRAVLNNGMVLFDDVFIVVPNANDNNLAVSDIEVIFIYKYRPELFINISNSIHIDRPNRKVYADSLVTLKEKCNDSWEAIDDNYYHEILTFQKIKETIHGCLI